MKFNFMKKKQELKDILILQIGYDEEELAYCEDKERKKELRQSIDRKLEALAKLEQSRNEGIAKVIVGILAFLGASVPVGLTIANYNLQYKRDRDASDSTQIDFGRSKFSPSNQVKRP